jgi:4-methylaminobutanoate oxidase (formaldehyde-forming)
LKGPDALTALNWICANNVDKPVGSLTYTQMLDDSGGIQCDLTVCRVADDEFYIVTGTGFATHDFDWIQRSIPSGANAQLFDVTSAYAVLSLMGPSSREILQATTRADLSNAAFPFGTQRVIGVAGCPVRALRVTYVGELGWELHLPVEYATTVYDTVMDAGSAHGLVNAGYRAIESCRLEKGYRAWGSDIGPDHTPIEAGLGWAVKVRSNVEFRGREAVAAQRTNGVRKMLAGFTTEPDVVLLGRETIFRDGQRVGWLTSGGFGYTVGRSIGYGYVRNADGVTADYVTGGTYELEVAGDRVPADVSLQPFYDPTNARVKS